MGLFGSNTKNTKPQAKQGENTMAYITKCMSVSGETSGCGTLHIDGTYHGNIKEVERLIIGIDGEVKGEISAGHVTISGLFEGKILCEHLEIQQSGKVSDEIITKRANINGEVHATIHAKEYIVVEKNGFLHTKNLQSKKVSVQGKIDGKIIATDLIEIKKTGTVEGEMIVKSIKVEEGGCMLGTMSTYDPNLQSKPKKAEETSV
jgi:cytoskeletal protein CcmA (bactofilin family)